MLTLDTGQLERQKKVERFRQNRERNRQLVRENAQRKEATVAADGDLTVTSLLQQMGQPLSSQAVIQRLEKMNRRLVFEVSNADSTKMGIYAIENRPQLDGSMKTEKKFICGMERGYMPERSVRHQKTTRVPAQDGSDRWESVTEFAKETRGWRTVLVRLLRGGYITPSQIDRFFPVSNGMSKNWQTLTTQ